MGTHGQSCSPGPGKGDNSGVTPASGAHLAQGIYIGCVFRGLLSSSLLLPCALPHIRVSLHTRRGRHVLSLFLLFCPYSALVVVVHVGLGFPFCSLWRLAVLHLSSPKGDHPSACFRLQLHSRLLCQQHRVWTQPSAPESPISKASVYIGLKEEFS